MSGGPAERLLQFGRSKNWPMVTSAHGEVLLGRGSVAWEAFIGTAPDEQIARVLQIFQAPVNAAFMRMAAGILGHLEVRYTPDQQLDYVRQWNRHALAAAEGPIERRKVHVP